MKSLVVIFLIVLTCAFTSCGPQTPASISSDDMTALIISKQATALDSVYVAGEVERKPIVKFNKCLYRPNCGLHGLVYIRVDIANDKLR